MIEYRKNKNKLKYIYLEYIIRLNFIFIEKNTI
jgi:hypothetical protein